VTTSLRLGFLVSGLLHVAVVAAFSISSTDEIPVSDEPIPLTLKLAMFEPAPAAPAPPPPPLVEEPQPLQPQEPIEPPPPPTLPEPVVRPAEPELSKPKIKPVSKPRPVVRKSRPRPQLKAPLEPAPSTLQTPPVAKAAVTKTVVPATATPLIGVVEKQHYLAALAAAIDRNKYYPLSSRRRGEEGTVLVRFVIQKDGEFSDLSVVESSGSRRLDRAALKTLRRVAPFRKIPESVGRSHWSITVPIAFSLRG
jgi:protein TonB